MTTTQKHIGIILLLGSIMFLFGNAYIAITDPVESNYALTAWEMLQSGDYVSPRIFGNYWYDKPAFFYWELIAAFKLFGATEFAARLFPGIFGLAGLMLTYYFAKRIYDERTAFMSAIILLTTFEFWLLGKTVITDMTLFVFFNAVLVFFYLAYSTAEKKLYYLCYIFAGLAVLTKGPIGLLLPGFIVTVFLICTRDFAEIKKMKVFGGTVLFLLTCMPWYYTMYQLHGNAFIDTFLGVHNVLRATVSEHPMWDVWWYYTAIFFIGVFPWSFSLPMVVVKYWKKRQWPVIDTTTLFLLLWAFLISAFYQCMATKYTTYTMPGLLPIAILIARLLYKHQKLFARLAAVTAVTYLVLTVLVAIPLCQDRSGKSMAEYFAAHAQADDVIGYYGAHQTSAVFYGKRTMYDLGTRREWEERRPQNMSWTSKNVTPEMHIEDMPKDKNFYLVLNRRKFAEFKKLFKTEEWQLLVDGEEDKIYYRPADKN